MEPIAPPEPTPAVNLDWGPEEVAFPLRFWPVFWTGVAGVFGYLLVPSVLVAVFLFFDHETVKEIATFIGQLLLGAFIAGLFGGGLMALSQIRCPICVNRRGIRQRNQPKVKVEWGDMTGIQLAQFGRLGSLLQIQQRNGQPLNLSLEMVRRTAFIAAVLEYAPEGNPVRKMAEAAVAFQITPD